MSNAAFQLVRWPFSKSAINHPTTNTMTPDAQQLAIAKLCGRKPNAYYCSICRECVPIETVMSGGIHAQCGGKVERDLPDYLNDLNAMHEAEKLLPQAGAYELELIRVVGRLNHLPSDTHVWMWHATAAQRAEAFLKVLNLWEGE